MTVYVVNILSIFIWKALFQQITSKEKAVKYAVNVYFFQMVLIAGLRGITVGTDTVTYSYIYYAASKMHWIDTLSYYIEPGYMIWNKFVSVFIDNFHFFLLINACLTYYLIKKFINRMSSDPIMAAFLFVAIGYFFSSMNVMRQYISIGFILLSIECYINKQNWKRSFLLVVLATIFHRSAVTLFAIFLFYELVYNNKKVKEKIQLKFFAVIVFSFFFVLFFFVGDKVARIAFSYIEVIHSYNDALTAVGFETSIFSFNLLVKILCSLLFFILKHKKKILKEDIENLEFINYLNIISCLLSVAAGHVSLLSRLNIYFTIITIVFIPNLLKYLKDSHKIKFIAYVCFFVFYVVTLPSRDIYPWVSFWTLDN